MRVDDKFHAHPRLRTNGIVHIKLVQQRVIVDNVNEFAPRVQPHEQAVEWSDHGFIICCEADAFAHDTGDVAIHEAEAVTTVPSTNEQLKRHPPAPECWAGRRQFKDSPPRDAPERSRCVQDRQL